MTVVYLCTLSGHALISTKFCEIISNGIKVIERTWFLYWKLQRGNNSAKNVGGVTVINLCMSSGHALYFYQVLWNYLGRYQSYRADTISILKITKGNNSAKNVGGVTVVNLCTSSSHALYFYQVLWNYLERYQSYRADTISILKISKGNNSAKNVGTVTILISLHVVWSCFIFVPSLVKLSRMVSKLWSWHEWSTADGRTDRWTDGQTDTQKFRGYNILPRHFLWRGIKRTNIGKNKQEKAHFQSHDTTCHCEPVYQIWSFYLKGLTGS